MQVPALFRKKQLRLLHSVAVEPVPNHSAAAETTRQPQLLEEVEVCTNRGTLWQESNFVSDNAMLRIAGISQEKAC